MSRGRDANHVLVQGTARCVETDYSSSNCGITPYAGVLIRVDLRKRWDLIARRTDKVLPLLTMLDAIR